MSTPPPHHSPTRPNASSLAPGPEHFEPRAAEPVERAASADREPAAARWSSNDYGATRLVNFRLPVDLHDRYRRLVAEVEQHHPRLRRASLTEVIIGLLEEGPARSTTLPR
jgi:hypothetical protein